MDYKVQSLNWFILENEGNAVTVAKAKKPVGLVTYAFEVKRFGEGEYRSRVSSLQLSYSTIAESTFRTKREAVEWAEDFYEALTYQILNNLLAG